MPLSPNACAKALASAQKGGLRPRIFLKYKLRIG